MSAILQEQPGPQPGAGLVPVAFDQWRAANPTATPAQVRAKLVSEIEQAAIRLTAAVIDMTATYRAKRLGIPWEHARSQIEAEWNAERQP